MKDKKLYSNLSKYEQKVYHYLYKSTEINRVQNLDFFLNIELINDAIKQRKKISFEYLPYDEEAFYYWALQYHDSIKILCPTSIIERIKQRLENNLNKYK